MSQLTIEEEPRQTLDNVEGILAAAGATMDDVVATVCSARQ